MAKNKKNKNHQEPIEREDRMELHGEVTDVMPGTLFKVIVEGGSEVLCTLGGKLRLNKIRILLGDRVIIEVSPYDLSRGRVIFRK